MKHMIKQKQSILVGMLLLIVGVLASSTTTAYGAKVSAVLISSGNNPGSALAKAQQVTVTGKVTDASTGEALPGVNVVVKGTTIGTATDAKGHYSLNIPSANDTLVYSYIGYTTQDISVNGRSVINVKLEQKAISGKQLVVVGYGTQRKESITGSVVSISGSKVNQVPSSNISSALQGRLPGVQIQQTSSQPGATMQIRIRGTRSLNANNNPLIVLNGVPFGGSLSDINPEQIKSINILKDASATAIYGSRGANGVILIQTYQGQEGQKPQISYNSYVGLKKIFSYYPMMNGPEFIALRKAAGQYSNGPDENNNVNTNWQKMFFRPSTAVSSQNLNVSGGLARGSYNFGLGYYTDQSPVPTQQFKRYTLNGSLDQKVGKYVQFGLTTNTDYNTSNGSQIDIYNVLAMSPIANPYNPDGTLRRTIQMPLDNNWNETRGIVDSLKNQWTNPVTTFGTDNTLYGIVNIPKVKGLKYRINVGVNYRTTDNNSFTGEGIDNSSPTSPSTAAIGHSVTLNWNIQNILTYNRTFLGKSHVNVTALYEATKDSYHSSQVSRKGIPNSAFQFYQLGAGTGTITIDPNNQQYQVSGLESWMGRLIYSYADRYFLTAILRSDGSSRLAPGHQWHTYPAVSAGWNIANESFMQGIKWIDQLKLRVGFGQTSNQAIAPYSTLGQLSTTPYNFGPTNYAVGYYVSQLPNANLGWEYSKTWNYGLDFGLFNNRLSGTIEYYFTKTNNVLLNVNLPNTSGVSSYTANIGKTQNKGLELSLNGTILNNYHGWSWTAGINVYGNRNKLVQLTSGATEDQANWWFVGHPINVIYDYKRIGLWQKGDKYLSTLEPGGNVGMIKVLYTGGYNADGTPKRAIGPDDRQIMNVNPLWQGGFNTTVTYKGFDFTAVGDFQHGGLLDATLYSSAGYLNLLSGRRNNVNVDYWTPSNTNVRYPKPGGITSGDNPKYGSTLGYFDASYLKIRTLTLGYDLSRLGWFKNSGISKLRFYVTVQNPFVLFSPFYSKTGLDPQTNSYGNQNAAVPLSYNLRRILTIGTNTPETRNYLFGINLTF